MLIPLFGAMIIGASCDARLFLIYHYHQSLEITSHRADLESFYAQPLQSHRTTGEISTYSVSSSSWLSLENLFYPMFFISVTEIILCTLTHARKFKT